MHSLLGAILDMGGRGQKDERAVVSGLTHQVEEMKSARQSQDINQVIHNRRHDRLFTPLSLSPCRDERSRGQAFKLPLFL